jgi:hypothetical protein
MSNKQQPGSPTSQIKSYTIAMIVSEVWHITVDAASEDEAKEKAELSYAESSCEEFSFEDSAVDGFEVIRVEDCQ